MSKDNWESPELDLFNEFNPDKPVDRKKKKQTKKQPKKRATQKNKAKIQGCLKGCSKQARAFARELRKEGYTVQDKQPEPGISEMKKDNFILILNQINWEMYKDENKIWSRPYGKGSKQKILTLEKIHN